MPSRDPRIDAYIERAAPFAQPILARARELVHEVCPQVGETIKWGMPTFEYAGGILCGMAAFKQHASFGFWKHALVVGDEQPQTSMGSYGKMRSLKDLPPKKTLAAHLKKAMKLNEDGVKVVRAKTVPKQPVPVHPAFKSALDRHPKAKKALDAFSPSHRREYLEWIADAKRDETRERRIATAIEWLTDGKSRNWKYENC